jgi:hypothetical protein
LSALKKNNYVSLMSTMEVTAILNAITRPAGVNAGAGSAGLQFVEVIRLLQWLHHSSVEHVCSPDHEAALKQCLALIKSSILALPLPQSPMSAEAHSINFSDVEAQERVLFVNTVYGMQNLVGTSWRRESGDDAFTAHFIDTLAVLFERKRMIQEAKVASTRSTTSRTISSSSVTSPSSVVLSRSASRPLLASSSCADASAARRLRSKIVFASSPQISFSEHILNCFSDSHSPSAAHPARGGRSAPAGIVSVSGNDIKRVLNGLHRMDSEHEEVVGGGGLLCLATSVCIKCGVHQINYIYILYLLPTHLPLLLGA